MAVLRHAKSRWDEADVADFDRPLNDRGWKTARRMGRELAEREITFDLVIASPAARVRETLDGVGETFRFTAPIRFEPRLYPGTLEDLVAVVQALPGTVYRPLLVGHNPGLQELLLELTQGRGDLRRRIMEKFPTCAFALVDLDIRQWEDIKAPHGRIAELILPRELG